MTTTPPPASAHAHAVRVLWLVKGLGPGGAEQLLLDQARLRDRDGLRCSVAYLVPWKDQLVEPLQETGVEVHLLGTGREWDLRWALALRRLLRRERIEVLHAHSPYAAAVARVTTRPMRRRHRPSLVYTEHNRWPRHARPTRWANRATFAMDDASLAVSDDVRSTITGRLRERVEVVRHGVNLARVRSLATARDDVRRELGIDPGTIVVGTVANLRPEKAYGDLLLAARQVIDRRDDVVFVAVGQGPLEAEVRAVHERLRLGDRFRLLGYRPDATRVTSAFDVFVLASRHEGLPVALLDALVLGVPVVSTSVGGVPDVVADGVEGRLVPPGRPDELARAVLDLVDDADARRATASAARRRGDELGIDAAVARVEAIYRSLARRRRRRS